jgi:hypothetical protein
MPETNRTGTILIRSGTVLPPDLILETEVFLPGWNAVWKLDGYGLGRRLHHLNWNFFHLAGEIKITVPGRSGDKAVRKAVKKILTKLATRRFNSLEITKVVAKRFLGIPTVSVTAHSRHIQKNVGLVPAKDFVLKLPAAAAGPRPGASVEQRQAELAAKQ